MSSAFPFITKRAPPCRLEHEQDAGGTSSLTAISFSMADQRRKRSITLGDQATTPADVVALAILGETPVAPVGDPATFERFAEEADRGRFRGRRPGRRPPRNQRSVRPGNIADQRAAFRGCLRSSQRMRASFVVVCRNAVTSSCRSGFSPNWKRLRPNRLQDANPASSCTRPGRRRWPRPGRAPPGKGTSRPRLLRTSQPIRPRPAVRRRQTGEPEGRAEEDRRPHLAHRVPTRCRAAPAPEARSRRGRGAEPAGRQRVRCQMTKPMAALANRKMASARWPGPPQIGASQRVVRRPGAEACRKCSETPRAATSS